MKPTLPLLSACAALALAACSREPATPAGEEATATPVAEATVPAPTPIVSPSPSPTPSPSATATASAKVIPQGLRGRWGLVAADCTSQLGDAKGLVTIGADQMKFYESLARLTEVRSPEASSFSGNFDFTGEGQTWKLRVDLALQPGGKTMIRRDTGADAMPGPLTYQRCG